jgi:pimeloyl-ACP methyl ester carboxylesterase
MSNAFVDELIQSSRMSLAFMRDFTTFAWWLRRERPDHAAGRVDTLDISTFYRAYGGGEPALMLHGGFMFAETWAGQIPELARSYRVITPDSRGHGRTTLGTRPLTYRQMAADAAALIESLELASVDLVGWSDGGCTGLALAMERPELVRSLVLLGTPFHTDNYSPEAKRKIDGILRPNCMSMLGMRAMRRLLTPEPEKGREFVEKMTAMWRGLPDFSAGELGSIEVPVLVIGCDCDEFLSLTPDPMQVFKDTAAAIPGARMEVVEGGTHSVHIERPKTVNSMILDFLGGIG